MKRYLLLLAAMLSSAGLARAADADSLDNEHLLPIRFEVKATGGITLINPTSVNDHLAYLNNSLNTDIDKVSSMTRFMIGGNFWISERGFVPVRFEYLSVSREYSYTAVARPDSTTAGTPFLVNAKNRYSVYPLSIGIGARSPGSNVEFEIDLIYALAYVTDEGSMGAYGNYSSTADTREYGLQVLMTPKIPITQRINLDFEIGYRYLYLSDFSDNRGRLLGDLKLSLSGAILGAGLSVSM